MVHFRWLIFLAGIPLILAKAAIGQTMAPDPIDVNDPMISDAMSVVTGLPYESVEQVSVTTTLPGGQIVVQLRVRRYRDSSGKTRIEDFPMGDNIVSQDTPAEVLIIDPAADTIHELQTARRTVYSVSISKLEADAAPPPALTPDPSQPINQPNRPADIVDDYVAALRPPPTVAWGKGEEDLGTQTVAGLVAHGLRDTRVTVTAVSSERATHSVDDVKEDWRSSDLQITLLSKHSSSHYGEVDARVLSIDRREPDPSLFQVPAEYKVMQP